MMKYVSGLKHEKIFDNILEFYEITGFPVANMIVKILLKSSYFKKFEGKI